MSFRICANILEFKEIRLDLCDTVSIKRIEEATRFAVYNKDINIDL